MNHDFHFVLKKETKEKIKNIAKRLKLSKSKTIIYIIKMMKPFLERYLYNNMKDDRGNYQRFDATDHLHAILDEKSYNLIKHITDNMKIFSMAITLRKIIEIFIKLFEKNQTENLIRKLRKINGIHLKRMTGIKKIEKKNRQLSNLRDTSTELIYHKLSFNKNFDVICIDFIT